MKEESEPRPSDGNSDSKLLPGYLILRIIRELALSTTDVSRLARYMRVVASESCPIP